MGIVTGPSLTSSTCMSAAKIPVCTMGCTVRAWATKWSYKRRPSSGAAAALKLGRLPPEVSAARVNWLTMSRPPCWPAPSKSCTLRFILPSASLKMRSLSSLASSLSPWASVSPCSAHTSTSKPWSILPTVAPSTTTCARRTRCTKAIILCTSRNSLRPLCRAPLCHNESSCLHTSNASDCGC